MRVILLTALLLGFGLAQRIIPTQPYNPGPDCRPAPAPRTLAQQSVWEEWPGYREKLEEYQAYLPLEPDRTLLMPVRGIQVWQVADTFGARRTNRRLHEGQDIFARVGTPVYSATSGFVWRMANGRLGGLQIFVAGAGGRRYYYAHFSRFAPGLKEGDFVTPETLLGYVGNTGLARTTPAHLHFGIYLGGRLSCDYRALDPLPLLRNRDWRMLGP